MQPNRSMRLRALFVLAAFVLGFFALALRLVSLQLIHGDEYKAKARITQLSDSSLSALRGTIYDRNMKILAQSASVWLVYVDPSKIENNSRYEETVNHIATGLAAALDVDGVALRDKILANKDKNYVRVKGEVEKPQYEAVVKFIRENDGYGSIICIDPDTKRYYPNSSLAASVIGFTDIEDSGVFGIERYYNEFLTGTAGRILTARDGNQNALPGGFKTVYAAEQGANVITTIDEVVQYNLYNYLKQGIIKTNAKYAYGIVMDVDTYSILGMVSIPEFDLNNVSAIDEGLYQQIMAIADPEKRSEELKKARNEQWSNRTVSATYEPGSVSKIITAAAAIEENVPSLYSTFVCDTQQVQVGGHSYGCWKSDGHGEESFPDLLKNSCNPFAIKIARELGADKFYSYFEAFGFTEQTGVDLPGEVKPSAGGTYHSRKDFIASSLASYSFGQSFEVSPIQVISMIAAVANGGYLKTPHVVDSIVDSDGNTIKTVQTTVKRQVISEETSKKLCENLKSVVFDGTGRNAYVAGYRVAGKTGTSEKLTVKGEYVASFAGFAPADAPKYAVLVIIDEPQGEHGGGSVAAPIAGDIFEAILPYLNVEVKYSEEELALLVDEAPDCIGQRVSEIEERYASGQYIIRVIGDGDTVVAQSPDSKKSIPKNGVLVLYTDNDYTTERVNVPNFKGMSVSEANRVAVNNGLNLKISGTSLHNAAAVIAHNQSVAAGTEVAVGTVITVDFSTSVGVGD